jgi:hypothetical protein
MPPPENDAGAPGARSAGKWSTENRVALIGVAAALLGSLVGGIVTWGVTQEQIASQREDARRAERLAAYETFAADAYAFWNQAQIFVRQDTMSSSSLSLTSVTLTRRQLQTLDASQAKLTPADVLVTLFAPDSVAKSARYVTSLTDSIWELLHSPGASLSSGKEGFYGQKDADRIALTQFLSESRQDLGGGPISGN